MNEKRALTLAGAFLIAILLAASMSLGQVQIESFGEVCAKTVLQDVKFVTVVHKSKYLLYNGRPQVFIGGSGANGEGRATAIYCSSWQPIGLGESTSSLSPRSFNDKVTAIAEGYGKEPRLLIGTRAGELYGYYVYRSRYYKKKWFKQLPSWIFVIECGDVNSDGEEEAIVTTGDGVYCLNLTNGNIIWQLAKAGNFRGIAPLAGKVAIALENELLLINASTGALLRDVSYGSQITLCKGYDNQSFVVGFANGTVTFMDSNLGIVLRQQLRSQVRTIEISDLDDDGTDDIIVGGVGGDVLAFSPSGAKLFEVKPYADIVRDIVVLNASVEKHVGCCYKDGTLVVLDVLGNSLWNCSVSSEIVGATNLDFDQDGWDECILVTVDGEAYPISRPIAPRLVERSPANGSWTKVIHERPWEPYKISVHYKVVDYESGIDYVDVYAECPERNFFYKVPRVCAGGAPTVEKDATISSKSQLPYVWWWIVVVDRAGNVYESEKWIVYWDIYAPVIESIRVYVDGELVDPSLIVWTDPSKSIQVEITASEVGGGLQSVSVCMGKWEVSATQVSGDQYNGTFVCTITSSNAPPDTSREGSTWKVKVTDVAGNVGEQDIGVLCVDLNPPQLTLDQPANRTTVQSGVVRLSVKGSDEGFGIEHAYLYLKNYTTNPNPPTQFIGEMLYDEATGVFYYDLKARDGVYGWNVTLIDYAGHRTSEKWLFRTEGESPRVIEMYPANGTLVTSTYATLTVTVQDQGWYWAVGGRYVMSNVSKIVFEYEIRGVAKRPKTKTISPNPGPINVSISILSSGPSDDGIVTWRVTVFDAAGNNVTSGWRYFIWDNYGPFVSEASPSDEFTRSSVTLRAKVGDYGVGVDTCIAEIDGQQYVMEEAGDGWYVVYVSGLSLGEHTWYLTANDTLGHTSRRYEYSFIVEENPPSVWIVSPINQSVPKRVVFKANATDSELLEGVVLIVDGNPVCNITRKTAGGVVATYEFNVTLTPGPHVWQAMAYDQAGNTNLSRAAWIYVDGYAPGVCVIDPANGTAFRHPWVEFKISAWDRETGLGSVTLYVDRAPLATLNITELSEKGFSAINLTLPDGVHEIYVVALDGAGNEARTSVITILVDATPPKATLESPEAGVTIHESEVKFVIHASDIGLGVRNVVLYVDGVPVGNMTAKGGGIYELKIALPDGTHTWQVVVYDELGNEFVSEARTFTIVATYLAMLYAFLPSIIIVGIVLAVCYRGISRLGEGIYRRK